MNTLTVSFAACRSHFSTEDTIADAVRHLVCLFSAEFFLPAFLLLYYEAYDDYRWKVVMLQLFSVQSTRAASLCQMLWSPREVCGYANTDLIFQGFRKIKAEIGVISRLRMD